MSAAGKPFTFGMEEEYLLVDPVSRDLAGALQEGVIADVQAAIDADIGFATPEFLQAQVEVGTAVSGSIAELRARLTALRGAVVSAAERHGLAAIAASTHPFANWMTLNHTPKERYDSLASDLQGVARRLVICGMHVHIGIDDDQSRIDLLNQMSYFLPHLLALSTSSPFWRGRPSGLMCYRLAVFDELPRTGLPERFDSWEEYQRHLRILDVAGVMQDASKLWWDARAHAKFPTIEIRIADICTRLDDGIAIAALSACILSMLHRLRRGNQKWRTYSNMLIKENRWRAQRYGLDEGLIDFGVGAVVPYDALLEELIELTAEDARMLNCEAEIAALRDIPARGTSAHNQLRVYGEARADGADEHEALQRVVDWLIAETKTGLAGRA